MPPRTPMHSRKGSSMSTQRGFHQCRTGGPMIKNSIAAAFVLIGVLLAGEPLFAQNGATQTAQPVADRERPPSVDEQIAMLRTDLRSTRKQVVAANMKLTDTEAGKVWPIYDHSV